MTVRLHCKARVALATIALVLLLDAASKYLAQQFLAGQDAISLIPWLLELKLIYNQGISFGLLATAPAWVRGSIAVVGALITCFALWQSLRPSNRWLSVFGWACFVGGAIGNLWQRVALGAVTDFLALKLVSWPLFVFNIADFALSLAIFLLLLSDLLQPRSGQT